MTETDDNTVSRERFVKAVDRACELADMNTSNLRAIYRSNNRENAPAGKSRGWLMGAILRDEFDGEYFTDEERLT